MHVGVFHGGYGSEMLGFDKACQAWQAAALGTTPRVYKAAVLQPAQHALLAVTADGSFLPPWLPGFHAYVSRHGCRTSSMLLCTVGANGSAVS